MGGRERGKVIETVRNAQGLSEKHKSKKYRDRYIVFRFQERNTIIPTITDAAKTNADVIVCVRVCGFVFLLLVNRFTFIPILVV